MPALRRFAHPRRRPHSRNSGSVRWVATPTAHLRLCPVHAAIPKSMVACVYARSYPLFQVHIEARCAINFVTESLENHHTHFADDRSYRLLFQVLNYRDSGSGKGFRRGPAICPVGIAHSVCGGVTERTRRALRETAQSRPREAFVSRSNSAMLDRVGDGARFILADRFEKLGRQRGCVPA